MSRVIVAIVIASFLNVNVAHPHSGGLADDGCHTVRTAGHGYRVGTRHCHNGGSSSEDEDGDLLAVIGIVVGLCLIVYSANQEKKEGLSFERVNFEFDKNNGGAETKLKFKLLEF